MNDFRQGSARGAVLEGMTSIECPCGRARVGCDYHDPALQPEADVWPIPLAEMRAKMVRVYGQIVREIKVAGSAGAPVTERPYPAGTKTPWVRKAVWVDPASPPYTRAGGRA